MNSLREIPIVMISMSRWDGDFSSASWSLAKTFSKRQPVIYVDYPYTLLDLWRERNKETVKKRMPALLKGRDSLKQLFNYGPFLYALTPPLMLPINWLPEAGVYSYLSAKNNQRLAKSIVKALHELGHNTCIFFNSFNPLYLSELSHDFPAMAFVYQSRDNIRALEPYLRKHGAKAEINAIKHADLSIATSRQLQADLSGLSGKTVEYLPNAADFETFKKAYTENLPVPDELKGISRPIIGYTGNICHRLDYELISSICESHPDKTVVMVGPRNHWNTTSIDLDAIPNLVFIDPKPIEKLPEYLACFDVLILPFLCNDVTKSIYPLKINEYLASGKPVIATPFSKDILSFGNVIRLEKQHESFTNAIDEELQSNSPERQEKRHQTASENTWDKRVALFWQLLENNMSKRRR